MSGAPREVEGVLLVSSDDPEAVVRRLAGLERAGRFRLLARPPERIRDTYLETGDGRLGRARAALRVRELDGRPLLTLKADATRAGLASERLELEAPWSAATLAAVLDELRGRDIDLADPGSAAGEPLAVLAALGLRPTQVRETTRTPRDVLDGDDVGAGPVAELAIDDVGYRFPAGRLRLLEAEVEAKGPGSLAVVQALLEALAAAFPGQLRPWPYGKLATGRAAERLLAGGALDDLLGEGGLLTPAAHDRLAGILAENIP